MYYDYGAERTYQKMQDDAQLDLGDRLAARPHRGLPDPSVTGPCQAQATFMCTGEAAGERLNPMAMLPGSTITNAYVPMCQPCLEHLSDAYVKEVHA